MIYEWLQHMSFAYPEAFYLLLLIPLLLLLYFRNFNKKNTGFKVSALHNKYGGFKTRLIYLPFICKMFSMAALVIVLARPQKNYHSETIEGEGIDIVLCMDVSGSMNEKDIEPSRLEVAKEVAVSFVKNRPVDRIGLVVFSGESFTQCPLTADKNTLITQIEALEARKYLADGTVIGEGLATAVGRLESSKAASRIIILITDGKEDPSANRLIDPLTALNIAIAKKVKVYTIGIGAYQPQANNKSADYVDVGLLQQIAQKTGGQFYRATDKAILQNIYNEIDQLEKSKTEIISFKKADEKFVPFMLAALFFLLAEIVLRYVFVKRLT